MSYTYFDLDVARQIGSNLTGDVTWGTNNKALFTSASGIYFNGTNLIIDPKITGSAAVSLNGADLLLNKIGIGGSAISANFLLNYQGSGTNRGAMQFDFTSTGTNIVTDLFLKVTNQNTNASPDGSCTSLQILKDADQSGTMTIRNINASFGTLNTRSITQGTTNLIGLDVAASLGVGTANTGGTVRDYGIRIQAFTGYTGVSSYLKWGINSEEDIQLITGKMLILEGSLTSKGDSGFLFDTTTANKIQCQIDGSTAIDWRQSTMNLADPYDIVLGTTTGTKIGTATTQKLGFYNKTPVVQQTDGAALTNSVTSGGTTDTIADFTNLTVYATDAATIRNDIYQLARKLKIVDDALRAYGLLS